MSLGLYVLDGICLGVSVQEGKYPGGICPGVSVQGVPVRGGFCPVTLKVLSSSLKLL